MTWTHHHGQERTAYEVSIMRPAEPEEFFL